MLPYKTILLLDKSLRTPLYQQISNEIIRGITSGIIATGLKLPGGRTMADRLGVSRRTSSLAYEELEAQGWVDIFPNKGVYVSKSIPIIRQKRLTEDPRSISSTDSTFPVHGRFDFLEEHIPLDMSKVKYVFDTGYPDVRISPKKALVQSFHNVINSPNQTKILNYAQSFAGHPTLRKELATYLSKTRGMHADVKNIFITRGSLMAFTCIFQVLLNRGDHVVVGDVSFKVANQIIRIAGGKILTVPVDKQGLDIDAVSDLCRVQKIRAVFVMPHHHHPTTVSLSAARRIRLLQLAAEYKFAIIEDDYDYDFHYSSSPILPMASADQNSTVIYVGSLSKNVAPGLRTGFIVGPENLIRQITNLSRFIDCHGNPAFERAIASLFREGVIRRHLKKALRIYRARRDHFCKLLDSELSEYCTFKVPEGGLAVWVQFEERVPLTELRKIAFDNGLVISRTVFKSNSGQSINAIRMGFASMDESELTEAVAVLKTSILGLLGKPAY